MIGVPSLDAQRFGARDQLLRIGNISRRDLVHHVGGRIAKHTLGADVEDLNDTLRVGGDAREIGAVEDRALQSPRLEQRLFRLLARGVVGALGDADPRPRLVVSISHGVAPVTCTRPTERIDCRTPTPDVHFQSLAETGLTSPRPLPAVVVLSLIPPTCFS